MERVVARMLSPSRVLTASKKRVVSGTLCTQGAEWNVTLLFAGAQCTEGLQAQLKPGPPHGRRCQLLPGSAARLPDANAGGGRARSAWSHFGPKSGLGSGKATETHVGKRGRGGGAGSAQELQELRARRDALAWPGTPDSPPDSRPVTFFVAPLHPLLLFLFILLLLREGDGIFDEAQVSHGKGRGSPRRPRPRCLRGRREAGKSGRVSSCECEAERVRVGVRAHGCVSVSARTGAKRARAGPEFSGGRGGERVPSPGVGRGVPQLQERRPADYKSDRGVSGTEGSAPFARWPGRRGLDSGERAWGHRPHQRNCRNRVALPAGSAPHWRLAHAYLPEARE